MMVYGYSDDSDGFVAFATGDGRVVRTETTRAGSALTATKVGTAIQAAEVAEDTYLDVCAEEGLVGTCKVFELDGVPDKAAPLVLSAAFTAAFGTAVSLHPNPTPALFQQYVHDDTAAGLQITPAPASVPDPADTSVYTTPDGHPYLPPIINGVPAVPLLQNLRARGLHCSLAGEPGTGKTTMAQVAYGEDLVVQGFHGETTVEDVVGRWVPRAGHPGDFRWLDGPLAVAMREGRPYLANELPRAPRETQAVFLPVMDHQRRLLIEGNPDDTTGQATVINANPGFVVIVDFNPGSGFGLTEALHSRITLPVTVPTDYSVARRLGVPAGLVNAAAALNTENQVLIREGGYSAAQWVPSIRDLLKAKALTDLFGLMFAAAAMVSYCPEVERWPAIADALSACLPDAVAGGLVAAAAKMPV